MEGIIDSLIEWQNLKMPKIKSIVKNKDGIMKKILFMLFVVWVTTGMGKEKEFIQNDYTLIKGTWHAENDFQSVWVFEDVRSCKQYYQNELLRTYTFEIGSNLSACDPNLPLNNEHTLLLLKSLNNNQCYFINGLTESTLSLSPIDGGKMMVFKK